MALSPETVERLLEEGRTHQCPGGPDTCVKVAAIAELPSRFGDFQVIAFWNDRDRRDHAAFVHGDVVDKEKVLVRLHSECLTGDAIGSLRCDCRDQLLASLERVAQAEAGVVLYLRQEGRGIGFANKIRAYHLQDQGYDTVEANEALGFRADEREYGIAAHMLGSLGIRSIEIMTNNPAKIADLQRHGVRIEGRIPLVVPPSPTARAYLETKQRKLGHLLNLEQFEESSAVPEGSARDPSS
jgi:GTP cyclohydrolase II